MNQSQYRYRQHLHHHHQSQQPPSPPPTSSSQQQLQQQQHLNESVVKASSSPSSGQICSSNDFENVDKLSEQSDLPPQILFLIKEHAKAVCDIRSINRRLKDLETKVESIYKVVRNGCNSSNQVNSNDMYNSSEVKVKNEETGNVPNVLSDDSGGEYSRTTTGTAIDEDELLSLLEQIAKCSNQIKQTHQNQQYQSQLLTNSLVNRSYHSYQQNLQPSTLQLHQHLSSSVNSIPGFYSASASLNQPLSTNLQRQHSVSALFFDPDVDRFLNSVNQLVDDQHQRHSMNGFTESSGDILNSIEKMKRARQIANLREQEAQKKLTDDWLANYDQRFHLQKQLQQQQRPQTQQFSQQSLLQPPSLANNYTESAGDTLNQSIEKIKRARQLVNLREQEGIQSQKKLTDDWLANYTRERLSLLKQPQQQQQQRSSSIQHLASSSSSSTLQQQSIADCNENLSEINQSLEKMKRARQNLRDHENISMQSSKKLNDDRLTNFSSRLYLMKMQQQQQQQQRQSQTQQISLQQQNQHQQQQSKQHRYTDNSEKNFRFQ